MRRGYARVLACCLPPLPPPSLQPTCQPNAPASSTHPRRPLLASATGETLLLLVQNAELLARCMPAAAAAEVLPALLVRAAQHGESLA